MSGGGAPADPVLTALWTSDPEAAAARVRAALEDANTIAGAAYLLRIPARTLYRWIRTKPALRLARSMTPRELRGAINRAKTVYAVVFYNARNYYQTKVSKEAARELAQAASEEAEKVDREVTAREEGGDLYIGSVPGTPANAKARDEEE